MLRWVLCFCLFAACSADADESEMPAGDQVDGGSEGDAAPSDDAGPQLPPVLLNIEFDYRFDDSGFFDDMGRRATLEAAAQAWGRVLADDFPTIPAGTTVRTRDPETPSASGMNLVIDRDIDDVLIFVACSDIDGDGGVNAISNHSAAIQSVSDATLRAELEDRYRGSDFQPWTGWISFDCSQGYYFDATIDTVDDIPGSLSDFWSVAMHEVAHVLGFGTAQAFVDLRQSGPMRFTGPNAMTAYGDVVPLSSSGTHLNSSVMSDGRLTLMDPSRPGGTRTTPTSLDIAVLYDLGYEQP